MTQYCSSNEDHVIHGWDAKFCSICGAPVKEKICLCKDCGRTMSMLYTNNFCDKCGSKNLTVVDEA